MPGLSGELRLPAAMLRARGLDRMRRQCDELIALE